MSGHVILLNGCSSSGKTSLALALQAVLAEPYQHIALDQFRDGMPPRYRGLNAPPETPGALGLNVVPVTRDGVSFTEVRFGEVGEGILRGMRRAIAAFAAAGNSVIVDDILLRRDYLLDYLELFRGLRVTFVGVKCPVTEIERRESRRAGRFPGTAIGHFDAVHEWAVYDLEVDTSLADPEGCALEVQRHLESPADTPAFERMRSTPHE